MEILILVGIIALIELVRLGTIFKPVGRKTHFKQKFEGVKKMIWDLEFKRFKTEEIREDVRKEYDYMKTRIATLDGQIKTWPKDKPEGDRKRIEDQKVLAERDMGRLEKQVKQLDVEIHGSRPTEEYHDGIDGIDQQIDSLRELKQMLKSWIKSL